MINKIGIFFYRITIQRNLVFCVVYQKTSYRCERRKIKKKKKVKRKLQIEDIFITEGPIHKNTYYKNNPK